MTDQDYRTQLSYTLGIKVGDAGLDEVPVYGHGSSFDGTTLTGAGVRDHVFERWRLVEDNPTFQTIIRSSGIQSIGSDLFQMKSLSTDKS